ncbi:zinc finger protein 558-like [Polypterus senegalus]|uniref:zinc finger protein 558-like n=1 Tax=Polypterus senegalus TaxID=55291 RepID=UPI00196540FE|nr:zinc finger protein 558-like [Polypterus senegalus]
MVAFEKVLIHEFLQHFLHELVLSSTIKRHICVKKSGQKTICLPAVGSMEPLYVHVKKEPSETWPVHVKHESSEQDSHHVKQEPCDHKPVSVKQEPCEFHIIEVKEEFCDQEHVKQEFCETHVVPVKQEHWEQESVCGNMEDDEPHLAEIKQESSKSDVAFLNTLAHKTSSAHIAETQENQPKLISEDQCAKQKDYMTLSKVVFLKTHAKAQEPTKDCATERQDEEPTCTSTSQAIMNVTWKNVGEKSNISITVPPHSFPKYLIMLKKLGNPTFDQNIQFGSKTSSKTNAEKQILNNSKDPSQQNIRVKVIHECPECGKIFPHKYSLQRHRKIHTGEKKYECTECGKKFIKRGMLQQHQSSHTGEKPFGCSECGRWYTRKGALKIHQRIHTGERPFVCFECGKRFTQKCSLQTHKRTHTGEKPYSCTFCEKTFAHQSGYQLHQKVHVRESSSSCNSMEKPYSCTECGKKFAKQGGLEAHKRVHTAKNTAHQSSFRLNVHSGENSSTVASDDPNLMCSSVTDGTYNEKPPGPL